MSMLHVIQDFALESQNAAMRVYPSHGSAAGMQSVSASSNPLNPEMQKKEQLS